MIAAPCSSAVSPATPAPGPACSSARLSSDITVVADSCIQTQAALLPLVATSTQHAKQRSTRDVNAAGDDLPSLHFDALQLLRASYPDLQLYAEAAVDARIEHLPGLPHDTAVRYDTQNKTRSVLASLETLETLETQPDHALYQRYSSELRNYWDTHFDSLQTLAEADLLSHVEKHRRSGNRAEALGLNPALNLSDQALAMLAQAAGQPDPDLDAGQVETWVFNINGYPAHNMLWLRGHEGRIVLLTPEDPQRPVREYRDLATMKMAIAEMLLHPEGRAMIERHFDMDNSTWAWGWSLSTWFRQIPKYFSELSYAIADYHSTPAAAGSVHLPPRSPRGQALLSDQALAMLSSAAGIPDPALPTQNVQAYLLDIHGTPAIDLIWLQGDSGRVVLLWPGNTPPVREYESLAAMRADLAQQLRDPAGRAAMAAHFPRTERGDRADGSGGIDTWLADIGNDGGNDGNAALAAVIAFDQQKNRLPDGRNVLHTRLARRRDEDLSLADALAQSAGPEQQRQQWRQALAASRRLAVSGTALEPVCDDDIVAPRTDGVRVARSLADDLTGACLRSASRLRSWGQMVRQRLQVAAGRLRREYTLPQQLPSLQHAPPRPRPLDNDYVAMPPLAHGGPPSLTNARGFIESNALRHVYRVVAVSSEAVQSGPLFNAAPDPLRHGFQPDHAFSIGVQALDGGPPDQAASGVIEAFLTPDAAWQAFTIRQGRSAQPGAAQFRLYRIDARQLNAVSFGLNRLRNPAMRELVGGPQPERQVGSDGGQTWGDFRHSHYAYLEPYMVQLRLDDDGLSQRAQLVESDIPGPAGYPSHRLPQ